MSKTKIKAIIIFSFFLLNCQHKSEASKTYALDIQNIANELMLIGENIISTSFYERDLAIYPNGNELIYTLGDYKQNKRCLVVVKRVNGNWVNPEIIYISGEFQNIEPFYSENGNRLYFASNRPIYKDKTRDDFSMYKL